VGSSRRFVTEIIFHYFTTPPCHQINLFKRPFKRSSDRNENFLEVKEDEANEQHKSIIEALIAAALEWTFEQINLWQGGLVQ